MTLSDAGFLGILMVKVNNVPLSHKGASNEYPLFSFMFSFRSKKKKKKKKYLGPVVQRIVSLAGLLMTNV